ncbi:hypothetical protein ACET3Z_010702 [Daucus carota]
MESAPWLSLAFDNKSCEKLIRYFELSTLPTVVLLGPDGKTLHPNVAKAIEEHGIMAYPFTPKKFAELNEMDKAKQEKDGVKVPVSEEDDIMNEEKSKEGRVCDGDVFFKA